MANTDTWAFFGLMTFFFFLGVLLPFISAGFGQSAIEQDLSGLPSSGNELETDSVSMLQVILSVTTIFFWTFGQVPAFVDLIILTPLRVLGVYLFVRMIRGI